MSWWQGKYVFTGGKEGAYYLLKADALGAFNKDNNNGNAWQTIPPDASSGDKSVSIGTGGIYSSAAYWPAGARLISTSCNTYITLKAWGLDPNKHFLWYYVSFIRVQADQVYARSVQLGAQGRVHRHAIMQQQLSASSISEPKSTLRI